MLWWFLLYMSVSLHKMTELKTVIRFLLFKVKGVQFWGPQRIKHRLLSWDLNPQPPDFNHKAAEPLKLVKVLHTNRFERNVNTI